jgi:hypothetical protein
MAAGRVGSRTTAEATGTAASEVRVATGAAGISTVAASVAAWAAERAALRAEIIYEGCHTANNFPFMYSIKDLAKPHF